MKNLIQCETIRQIGQCRIASFLRKCGRKSFTEGAQLKSMHRQIIATVLILACTSANFMPTTALAETAKMPRNSGDPVTIGILGDSLSAGYGLKPEETWVQHIQTSLQSTTAIPPIKFVNASVSGATTDAGIQMLPALLKQKPDIVILELGANDGLQGKPLPLIYQNLTTLIQQIKAHNAEILLLGMRLPPNLGKRYTQPFYLQFQSLATSFELNYIPFFIEDVAGKPEYMQNDGLHPNAKAQPIIAERVLPELITLLQKETH